MDRNELFESMPVGKAVRKMSFPLMASLLVTVIYNMADTFFVAQTGDANQVAAVSLTAPVFMLLMALGNIFGMGGASFISRTLGEKNEEKVKKISSFCFYSAIILGIITAVVLIIAIEPISKLLGTSENTLGYCKTYLTYYMIGAPLVLCSFTLSNIIRSEGASKEAMIGNMLGTVINIILDPIMILGLNMGVAGAAIATVIGNAVAVIYFIVYIIRRARIISISPKHFSAADGIIPGIMTIGVPASVNNILMSISFLFVNNYLKAYGDNAIAAMGIANKVISLVTLLLVGFSAGMQPLLGYCYGAKNFKRLREILKYAFTCVVIGGTIGGAIIFVFADPIIKVFINDAEIIEYGTIMLRVLISSAPIVGIVLVLTNTFQGMGKGAQSMILSVSRQGLIFIPVIAIMNNVMGMNGTIAAQPITDLITVILAVGMFIGVRKELKQVDINEIKSEQSL